MFHDLGTVPADRRIDTHRVVPFTPAQVFNAFADPHILSTWWGPNGFTNTFEVFDFSEAGEWRFMMHSPDGKDYANESRFAKIVKPFIVIIDHLCAPLFQAHFSFNDTPDGCQLDWSMVFENAQTCSNVKKFAGDANEQNIDRLVAALKKNHG